LGTDNATMLNADRKGKLQVQPRDGITTESTKVQQEILAFTLGRSSFHRTALTPLKRLALAFK